MFVPFPQQYITEKGCLIHLILWMILIPSTPLSREWKFGSWYPWGSNFACYIDQSVEIFWTIISAQEIFSKLRPTSRRHLNGAIILSMCWSSKHVLGGKSFSDVFLDRDELKNESYCSPKTGSQSDGNWLGTAPWSFPSNHPSNSLPF